jgi:anti-sigma28 factor (negative regulator of flagellin synthesis)
MPEGWWRHVGDKGRVWTNFRTDGTTYVCMACELDPDMPDYEVTDPKKMGGHQRTRHMTVASMWTPEARDKAQATRRANKQARLGREAIALVSQLAGLPTVEDQTDLIAAQAEKITELEQVIAKGTAQVKSLTALMSEQASKIKELSANQGNPAEVVEWKRRAEDAETKLTIMRETLGL